MSRIERTNEKFSRADAKRVYDALIDSSEHVGDFVPVPIGWLVGKLSKIANTGQSVEPDHWQYRCMARETAQEILDKLKAVNG